MDHTAPTFATWTAALTARGFTVLPASHAVPVRLWLRTPDGDVLSFLARGTRLTLSRYRPSDLTGMILRSECDCAEHRTAGAAQRTVLVPGARPVAEVTLDGAAELGWRGVEAGMLDISSAAGWFDHLLARLARSPREVTTARPAGDMGDPGDVGAVA